MSQKLPLEFYQRTDVVQIARDLLGKVLVTNFEGVRTSGRISETEAYRAPDDRACHAWNNRRTNRTEVMFAQGGRAYVYLCYGIHHLFNVVTAPEDLAHAVLIRSIEPLEGIETMLARRNKSLSPKHEVPLGLTTGPGALGQALGLTTHLTGQRFDATDSPVWIEDWHTEITDRDLSAGPRIGVDYAGECAAWPWRFWLTDSRFVKR